MDALATKEQMAARSQGAIPADQPYLEPALKAASGRVRAYCGWHIAAVEKTTAIVDDLAGAVVRLPSLRVVSVDAVRINGVDSDPAQLRWIPDGRLVVPYRIPGYRFAEVDLTHGFDSTPDEVVDLVLQIAARALGSPLGVVTEKSLTSSVTWAQTAQGVAGGVVLMDHEKPALAPYRLGWLP